MRRLPVILHEIDSHFNNLETGSLVGATSSTFLLSCQLSDLFRDEVVQERASEIGLPLSVTSSWMNVFTIVLVIAIVSILLVIATGSYSRKEAVTGFLIPAGGLVKVITPKDGQVVESRVSEGQHVELGEILFVVDVGTETSTGQTTEMVKEILLARRTLLEEEIARLEAVHQSEADELAVEIQYLRDKIELVEVEVGQQQNRLKLAEDSLSRQQSLLETGVISTARLQQSERDVVLASLELLAHQRSLLETQGQLAETSAQQRGLSDEQENDISELQRELAIISQQMIELAERQTILIRSPAAGVATRVTVGVGSTVISDSGVTPMLMLVPEDAKLEAHLFAPSSAIGFVREGAEILLRYDAFPYQKFGLHRAYVTTISQTSVNTDELPFRLVSSEPLYVITASLESQAIPVNESLRHLQAGARFHADLILEERKLWEWIVGPLAGVQSRL